jgi:hypothetical protein
MAEFRCALCATKGSGVISRVHLYRCTGCTNVICSKCLNRTTFGGAKCPNCGAKIDQSTRIKY